MTLQQITKTIQDSRNIVIMGHQKGDTDCFGSSFALARGLENIGKNVQVIVPVDFPESLNYLLFYFSGDIVQSVEFCDLLILIDSSDLARVLNPDLARKLKTEGTKVVMIDHHTHGDLQNFADISLVDEIASSASELTYRLLDEMKINIDKNMATCLLAGIIGDTTSFQNQNTTEASFSIASELMKKGARLPNIINNTFGGKDVDVLKLWGLAMERLRTDNPYGIVFTYLTYDDISQYGLSADATSGIVNFLNSIKNARVIALITQEEKGIIKVSLRTRDPYANVASIAKQLGGGGHIKAAAFSFPGTLKMLTEGSNSHIVIV